jgi:hypothetical protein
VPLGDATCRDGEDFKVSRFHAATVFVFVGFDGLLPEQLDWQDQIA